MVFACGMITFLVRIPKPKRGKAGKVINIPCKERLRKEDFPRFGYRMDLGRGPGADGSQIRIMVWCAVGTAPHQN